MQWKNICPWRPEAKLRWAGGAQRPVGRGKEPKKTGARSARARTGGQNPLVGKEKHFVSFENDQQYIARTVPPFERPFGSVLKCDFLSV
jgi:hypothetical protein